MLHHFFSERVKLLVAEIQVFLEEKVYPHELSFAGRPFSQIEGKLQELREEVKAQGLWVPHLPEEEGGLGLSLTDFAPISEVLGSTPYGHYLFNCQAPDVGNMELLAMHGSEEIRQQYLYPLQKGDIRSCFAMTEPEFCGSNPTRIGTTATKDGGEYIINGHKWFASSADGAAFCLVMAVTNPKETNPYQRSSILLVPTKSSGFQLVRNIPVMGEAGDGYASHGEVRFKDCRVPEKYLIGEEGAGFRHAQERLGPGRIHHCMRWIGICERAFDMMCHRAAERLLDEYHFLGQKQFVQQWIAESRAEIDAARLMVLNAAYMIENIGAKAARFQISAIKFFVANILQKVLDRAIQVHGALGMTDHTLLAYWYRHERAARIYDGPDEVHKEALAKNILRQYQEVDKTINTTTYE